MSAPTRTTAAFDPARTINTAQSGYLDVIRGLAAQVVLLHHATGYCLPASGLGGLGGGAIGVLSFFLLSGFLITDNIQSRRASGGFSMTEFTVSRFCRIYLPYIPAILLVAALDRYAVGSPIYEYASDYTWPTALANVFMLQDYPVFQILRRLHMPDQPWFFKTFGSGRQFWTVSIEWWIYLAVGFATMLALRGRRPSPWLWLVLGVLAVEPLYNLVGGPGDCLTLAWLFGAGANLAYRRLAISGHRPLSGLGVASWVGLAVLAGVRLFFTHGRIYDAVFELLYAGLLFVPLALLRNRRGPVLAQRLGLDRLSFHSYSLYLTHLSVLTLLLAVSGGALLGWAGMIVILITCNAVAIPFAFAFEVPHRRLRRAILQLLGQRPGARQVNGPNSLGMPDKAI